MELTINIEDYLTPEDIKAECKEAVKNIIYNQYKNETAVDRLITNLSYEFVFEMVNNAIDGNLEKILKEKIIKIIDELSSYSVFRRKDAWDREDSKGYKILNEEVERQRDHIKMRIFEIIEKYDFKELKDSIGDCIYECIDQKLFGNKTQ